METYQTLLEKHGPAVDELRSDARRMLRRLDTVRGSEALRDIDPRIHQNIAEGLVQLARGIGFSPNEPLNFGEDAIFSFYELMRVLDWDVRGHRSRNESETMLDGMSIRNKHGAGKLVLFNRVPIEEYTDVDI